jgi:hypothetical protein
VAVGVLLIVAVGVRLRVLDGLLVREGVARALMTGEADATSELVLVRVGDGVLERVPVRDGSGDLVRVGFGETVGVVDRDAVGQGQMPGGDCPLLRRTDDAMVSPERPDELAPVSCAVSKAEDSTDTV